ncbi:MAG: hypothetical protein JWN04_3330 [Myxococcaceae bacterium]|nr:hypothetical protein [Myxococcaceae bacterium]
MRQLAASLLFATTFALTLASSSFDSSKALAQPTTDARDYEGAGAVPNKTLVVADYLRHQTTSQKKNLTQNIDIFRATYVLRAGSWAFVPFDAFLPVADADLKVYTNPTMPMAPPSLRPQGNPIAGSIRTSGIGDLQYLPSVIYDHVERKEDNTHTYAGAQVYVTMPTGNYSSHNVVNIGENRWSFKPQLALGQRFAKIFTAEAVVNMLFYTDNSNYHWTNPKTGKSSIESLRQDPTFNAEVHLAADLAPTMYVSASYYLQAYGEQFVASNHAELQAKATVHTMRFNWGIRVEKQTLILLQMQQDLKTAGEFSNSRFFGARVSHFFF